VRDTENYNQNKEGIAGQASNDGKEGIPQWLNE